MASRFVGIVGRGSLAVAGLVLLSACSSARDDGTEPSGAAAEGSLAAAFAKSARGAAVPRDLLVAVARIEEGLTIPRWREDLDVDNEVPAAGPLQLRRGKLDTLALGAALVSRSELDLRRDADLALEAGARVLADLGSRTGAREDDLASWKEALEELGGFADAFHRARYAHDVFVTLARGGTFVGRDGEVIVLPPHDLPPALTLDVSSSLRPLAEGAEYAGAEWYPTSCTDKCYETREGASVETIIIHDTEGGWNSAVASLQNSLGKSAHYLVGADGRVAQFITEDKGGWHCGNKYYNLRSIGVEHVGYATQPFPTPQYVASAKLVAHLADKYAVPKDRAHVIGHDQVPNLNKIPASSPPCSWSPARCQDSSSYGGTSGHNDPGVWEWATYMVRVGGRAKCNDVTAILNCSSDKTQAFRCLGGVVETLSCGGGCEVQPIGVDDLCIAPAGPRIGQEAPVGERDTSEPNDSPWVTGTEPSESSETTSASITRPFAAPTPRGGCAVTHAGTPFGGSGEGPERAPPATLFLALSAILAAARRRR